MNPDELSPRAMLLRHPVELSDLLARVESEELGASATSERDIACEQLLFTYQRRYKLLSRLSSPHGQRLRLEVKHFCSMLELHREGHARVWSFGGADGTLVSVFEEVAQGVLLGRMHSFDRRKIDPKRWREIWGEEEPIEQD